MNLDNDKINNVIRKLLREVSEEPGIAMKKKMDTTNKKINKDSYNDTEKKFKDYSTTSKKEDKDKITPPKRMLNDKEQEFHDEIELSEDNLDLTYDEIGDNEKFNDRVEKSLVGDSTMGNRVKGDDVVGVEDNGFGEKLIQNKLNRHKNIQGKTAIGPDSIVPTDKSSPLNIGSLTGKDAITSEKTALEMGKNKKVNAKKVVKESDDEKCACGKKLKYPFEKQSGRCDGCESLEKDDEENKRDMKSKVNNKVEEPALVADNVNKNNKKNNIVENNNKVNKKMMKKITFKKPFNGKDNALNLIPESMKVNLNEFVLTDNINETYKIRWEGSSSNGTPIILKEENKVLVSEEMLKIKKLMNYKSSDTNTTLNGQQRLTENENFNAMLDKSKKMVDGLLEIKPENVKTISVDKNIFESWNKKLENLII